MSDEPLPHPADAARFFGYSLEEWTSVRAYWLLEAARGEIHGGYGGKYSYVRGGGAAIVDGKLVSSWFWSRDEYPIDISISPANDARKERMRAADIYGVG